MDDPRAVPRVPDLKRIGEGPDRESRAFLWFAIRRVYAAHGADADAFPIVTAEGVAELRGITETLFSVTSLSHDAAAELLEPVVGRSAVDQWNKHRVQWS